MKEPKNLVWLVGIGALAGVASGLLGVGGGIVMVPLLVFAAGLSQHQAHATSLAAIVPIAAMGAVPFAVDGRIDYGIAALLALGSLIGAPIGARLMAGLQEAPLKIAFGTLQIVVAGILIAS
ncbi:MAG: TSUP family transporter [Gammaproteobacteria bacterium]